MSRKVIMTLLLVKIFEPTFKDEFCYVLFAKQIWHFCFYTGLGQWVTMIWVCDDMDTAALGQVHQIATIYHCTLNSAHGSWTNMQQFLKYCWIYWGHYHWSFNILASGLWSITFCYFHSKIVLKMCGSVSKILLDF